MRYVIQRLLRGGMMGMNLLQTFVSHHVQPLRQREMTIWMYPGSSYPDRPFSVELGDTEINTQIRGVSLTGLIRILALARFLYGKGVKAPG
jgi:hypothetical protein